MQALVIIYAPLSLLLISLPIQAAEWEFKIGIMEGVGSGMERITKETTQIPLRLVTKSGERFFAGFIAETKSEKEYEIYSIYKLPGKPATLSDELLEYGEVISPKEFKGPTTKHRSRLIQWFYFHEGDPLGEYKLDVYINDIYERTILFEVVPDT